MLTTDEGIASGKATPERMESPFGFFVSVLRLHLLSPVFDLLSKRFIAIASVECASFEMEPLDITHVTKRRTISFS